MRQAFLFISSLLVAAVVSHAADPNVALNKPVTLNGSFPVFTYPGGLCGVNPPQPAASTVVNGVFLPEQSCFQSGIYWSADPAVGAPNPNDSIDINLGGTFLISSATVQADNNDSYTLQYRDIGGVYHDWWLIAPSGPFGLITRPNSADQTQRQALSPVLATGLRFFAPAGSGDLYYAVSQIAVFGTAVNPADSSFQVRYGANPAAGESYINIVNTGANGAPLLGPGFGGASGNICVNVYAFSPDEQLIACCSCHITPNGVVNLGVNRDLTIKTLTGVVPSSVVVKLVSTLAGTGGTGGAAVCNNSAATLATATPVPGMLAWGTTLHAQGTAFATTETAFRPATLSDAEKASIGGRCASILGNGSGFGVCLSCRAGALGGTKK